VTTSTLPSEVTDTELAMSDCDFAAPCAPAPAAATETGGDASVVSTCCTTAACFTSATVARTVSRAALSEFRCGAAEGRIPALPLAGISGVATTTDDAVSEGLAASGPGTAAAGGGSATATIPTAFAGAATSAAFERLSALVAG